MKARKIQHSDNGVFLEWAKIHGFTIPIEALPDTGVIVDDLCMAYLYLTNSCFCMMAWQTSNPGAHIKDLPHAFDLLVEGVKDLAKEHNSPIIYAQTNKESLARLYKRHGFIVGDTKLDAYMFAGVT